MSDTPRTDALYFRRGMLTMYDLAGEMKKLERELNTANARMKALIEAGDVLQCYAPDSVGLEWAAAKEGSK